MPAMLCGVTPSATRRRASASAMRILDACESDQSMLLSTSALAGCLPKQSRASPLIGWRIRSDGQRMVANVLTLSVQRCSASCARVIAVPYRSCTCRDYSVTASAQMPGTGEPLLVRDVIAALWPERFQTASAARKVIRSGMVLVSGSVARTGRCKRSRNDFTFDDRP